MVLAAEAIEQDNTKQPEVRDRTLMALDGGIETEIVSFNNLCDDREHVALVFPEKNEKAIPLVRLHSECLTGDAFGSAQCDCGDQLREAKEKMARQGGILLYLRQEGRGIGLYNKISTYRAQREQGMDTFAANRHLGFEDDLRNFQVAAEMLLAMGINRVQLLTNNPDKVSQLEQYGITIETVIPTGRFEKEANRRYLQTKREKGHTV